MKIIRDHERRYYRHPGEYVITLGRSEKVWFRFHMTTPRHRFNFTVWRKRYLPWHVEADKLRASN